MKKIFLVLGLVLFLFPQSVKAQQKVFTIPIPLTSVDNESSSIAVTNTFQKVFSASTANTGRVSCTIQNTGTNPMYVYFGPTANATIAASVKIIAGQPVTCDSNNTVIKTEVAITGTATETYYASQQ